MTFLLVYDYNRADLTEAILECLAGHDLHFIYYKHPPTQQAHFPPNITPPKLHFWAHYRSPQALLHTIQPDKILFADIETYYEIALLQVARKRKIETLQLQHGARFVYEVAYAAPPYSSIYTFTAAPSTSTSIAKAPSLTQKIVAFGKKLQNTSHTLRFLVNGVSAAPLQWFVPILRFVLDRSRMPLLAAQFKHKHAFRLPDYYIEFSSFNAQFILVRDAPSPENVLTIGNYFLDTLIQKATNSTKTEPIFDFPYYILVDSPVAHLFTGYTYDEQFEFYRKLHTFCTKQDAKLVVKLHPKDYTLTIPNDIAESIHFVKDEHALSALIVPALGCFGILSTLVHVLCRIKPTLLFTTNITEPGQTIAEKGLTRLYCYKNFGAEELSFAGLPAAHADLHEYDRCFLYRLDGNALARLKAVLCGTPPYSNIDRTDVMHPDYNLLIEHYQNALKPWLAQQNRLQ